MFYSNVWLFRKLKSKAQFGGLFGLINPMIFDVQINTLF